MKKEITANPAYRKVIADLHSCEERYSGLLATIDTSSDGLLAAALETLKGEVRQRRRLEKELLAAVEKERQRIGQDLHDDLCQRLGATALLTASLLKRFGPKDKQLGRNLARVPKLINDTIESCRDLARGLHPITLASRGLPAALEELAERIPLGVKFNRPLGARIRFEPEVQLHLYRIAEEAVGNAIKHAAANNITVELEVRKRRPVLVISDNGKGFGKKLKTKGMGLRNMQFRANAIGAELMVEGRKGGGTRVSCRMPLPKKKS